MNTATLLKPSEAFARLNVQQQVEQPKVKEQTAHQSMFGWNVGNFGLLLDDGIAKELTRLDQICRIPHSPQNLLGFINVASQVIPVFMLEPWLHLKAHTRYDYALLIGKGKHRFALALAHLPQKVELADAQAIDDPQLPMVLAPFVKQCFMLEQLWCHLDLTRFMDEFSQFSH